MSAVFAVLSRFEEGALAESFMAMGEKAVGLAHHEHEQARKLVASFEAPFKVGHFSRLHPPPLSDPHLNH